MFRIINLKKYILQVFDLKEEELKKTLLLQLNIFLLITTLLIVKPTVNSLFLSELTSDALPLGYVLTAIMAIVGSYFYNRMLENYSLNIIIERTILGSVISLIIFGFLFNFDLASGLILYIPYVWVAIFGLLTASQFWILANLVYNVREAKRVFGFIGAGAIAGGIFGGYLTSLLSNTLEAENLLFVAAFLLMGCLPITRYIWKHEVVKLNTFQVSQRSGSRPESALKLIKESRLLTLIAVVIGISVLVAKLVDYQYSDYASRLIPDPEELAAFFGFWFSTLSVISLLIQLFLTKRIVGTFGVGKSLLWLPSGILIGSLVLLFFPQLWVIVFIKVIDGSLKQSVNKAATELLSIPIPIETKKKTKTFTDVVVDSIATGLAGFILIFFINALDISSTYISLIIVVLILVWLFFIYHLRKEYITSFKKLLETSGVKKEKQIKKEIPVTSIVGTVNRVLESGTQGQIMHMLQKTLSVKDERFFQAIKGLLSHTSAKVRALAIENLYFLKTENLSDSIELMVHDKDQEVTTSAFRYLLKNYNTDPVELFNKYAESEDSTITNAALIGLSLEVRNHKKLQERFNVEQRIKTTLQQIEMLESKEEKQNKLMAVLEGIGNARLEPFYDTLAAQLGSDDRVILETAIRSAARTLDLQFINPIVAKLSEKEVRQTAIDSLFSYGEPMIKILSEKIKNETIELEDAIHCITVIEKFASQKAMNALTNLTEGTEHSVKIEAIDAIKRLKWGYSSLKVKDRFVVDKVLDECHLYQNTLSVIHSQIVIQYKKTNQQPETAEESEARKGLIHLLEQRLDRQLQRIFRLLGIKYPPNDMDPILDSILHGKEEQRIHAIEFLDNILDNQLKKELIPVAESILLDTISEEKIKKLNLKVYSEEECYQALLSRKDLKLKLAVLYLIEQTGDQRFIPLLEMARKDPNEKVHKKASEIMTTIKS
ncbi:AAA family ATP:ADP antiporter [Ulvibacter sp. MAR_2010_11]|uniref:Npt1/Npt2 family nucleotide transporter n=1 Tax=Ulvibacter sp. MAR_2010_11 TaxID=1250229 RepID=UPI000C2B9047|nr:Npt1/Npt2 family nucleotide transporter [Ulvibacter sp. MAR_2010_11]PKA83828.1 AAA family ATP:ADP antiporter [Ulvibacter sp. MAR_2010_11]